METNIIQKDCGRAHSARQLVMAALFVALGYVGTSVLMVPVPTGGYVNLGDAVVLTGACLMGPVFGAAAGGLGPALADFLGGYGIYVPGTLVIKALMGAAAAILYRVLRRTTGGLVVSAVAAEAIMVVGYALYDAFLAGSPAVGLSSIPANLIQALFGASASVLLVLALRKNRLVRRLFPYLGGEAV